MDKQSVVNAYNGILLSAKKRNEVFMKPQKRNGGIFTLYNSYLGKAFLTSQPLVAPSIVIFVMKAPFAFTCVIIA